MQNNAQSIVPLARKKGISVLDFEDYKELVCSYLAGMLEFEYLRGNAEGISEVMEPDCGLLAEIQLP